MARDLSALTNTELRTAYKATRAVQHNASRMNRAAGVFAMEAELEAIWAEADSRAIALLRPELDPEPAAPASSYALSLAIQVADQRMRAADELA